MNLAERDGGKVGVSGDVAEQAAAVFEDGIAGVRGSEAEVEFAGALAGGVNTGCAAGTGTESAEEPGDFLKERRAHDLNAILWWTRNWTLRRWELEGMLWLTLESGCHELAAAVTQADGGEKLVDLRGVGCGFRKSWHSAYFKGSSRAGE